jgi:hypothetical protein
VDEEALWSPLGSRHIQDRLEAQKKQSNLETLSKVSLSLITVCNVLSSVAVYEFGNR